MVSISTCSSFILKRSFKIQNFRNKQTTLGNTNKSLSPNKPIKQIFSSALKSYEKAEVVKTKSWDVSSAFWHQRTAMVCHFLFIYYLQNNVVLSLHSKFFIGKFWHQPQQRDDFFLNIQPIPKLIFIITMCFAFPQEVRKLCHCFVWLHT